MKTLASTLVLAAAAAALPPIAAANKVERLSISNLAGFSSAPEFEVYSLDGERWTTVDATDLSKIEIGLSAACRWEGKGDKAYRGELRVPGWVLVGQKEPANFLIGSSSRASGVYRWDGGTGQPFDPVRACNDELDRRLATTAGANRYSVLADGLTVNVPAALQVQYVLTCNAIGLGRSDLESRTALINARVKCEGSPLAAAKIPGSAPRPPRADVPPRRAAPLVAAARFDAEPEVHTGTCPATIRFVGSVTSSGAGVVTYRYAFDDGRTSPEHSLTFSGPRTHGTREWTRTVAPRPADAIGRLAVPGGTAGVIDGWVKLEVLSPPPARDVVAHYRVLCDADDEPGPPERARAAPARASTD